MDYGQDYTQISPWFKNSTDLISVRNIFLLMNTKIAEKKQTIKIRLNDNLTRIF